VVVVVGLASIAIALAATSSRRPASERLATV
jgi:hypothetical protein